MKRDRRSTGTTGGTLAVAIVLVLLGFTFAWATPPEGSGGGGGGGKPGGDETTLYDVLEIPLNDPGRMSEANAGIVTVAEE